MKKVTFVISTLLGGGAERVISEISGKLSYEYEVSIILLLGGHEKVYKINERVKIIEIPRINNRILRVFGIPFQLGRTMKKEDSDIFISFCTIENVTCLLANKYARKKVFISERNAPMAEQKGILLKIFRKILYNSADGIIFQTDFAKKFYSDKIQKKGIVIPNPIKSDIPYKEKKTGKVVCAVGRLNKQKNYPLLINAFSIFLKTNPDYILKIYGKGDEEAALKKLIFELSLDGSVKLEGFKKDVHDEMKKSSIYVMSSDYEGMPNALMEAMAIGLPCISTDCPSGGPQELIDDGVNGFLIPVNDKETLVEKLNYLATNKAARQKTGDSAKKVREKYNIDSIVIEWKKILDKNI